MFLKAMDATADFYPTGMTRGFAVYTVQQHSRIASHLNYTFPDRRTTALC